MRGILIRKGGQLSRSWSWADASSPCGIDIPVEPGDQIMLCNDLDQGLFNYIMARLHEWTANELLKFISEPDILIVPPLLPAQTGYCYCYQPGYRRICLRPTDEELDRQVGENIRGALANGSRTISSPRPILRRVAGSVREGLGDEAVRYGLEFPHHEVVHEFPWAR